MTDHPTAAAPTETSPASKTAPATSTIEPRRASAAETRLTASEWGLLAVLTLMQFSVTIDFLIIAPLGPQLMRVFNIDTVQFGHTVAAYAFGAGISSFTAAFFLDRFDRKRALLVLYTGFTLGTLSCALANGYWAMLLARFATGICGGVCGGVILAIVGDAIPEIRRATAMGTLMSAFALAMALGVPASLWMAEHGWHWPFLILGVLCALILPAAIWLLPRSDKHLRADGTESPGQRVLAVVANANHLRALSLMAALTVSGFMVVPFISEYLVRNVGVTEPQLKYNFLCGGLCTLFSMNLIGRLADMYGRRRVFTVMALCSMVATLALTHLPAVPLAAAIAATTCFMIASSGRFVPAIALITSSVEPRHRGGFMSLNSCVQSIFSGVGATIGGYILIDAPHRPLGGYGTAGWISVALAALGIYLAGRVRRADDTPSAPDAAPVEFAG